MAQRLKDITGNKFGLLTAIEYSGNEKWKCKCECGNIVYVTGTKLRRGDRTHCGCKKKTRLIDLTGQRFGRLTVTGRSNENRNGRVFWDCVCDCGKHISVSSANIGRTVNSCGCLRSENTSKMKTIHGNRNTKLYGVWCSMKSRCHNPNTKSYKTYGAIGIEVCREWREDFAAFYKWSVNNGYKEGLQIDRIDNQKGYEPSNCRWVTRKENMNNTSINVFLEYDGKRHTLSEWSDIIGIPERLISQRLKNGWGAKEALFGKNSRDT